MRSVEWQLGILRKVRVFASRDRRRSLCGRSCLHLKIEVVPYRAVNTLHLGWVQKSRVCFVVRICDADGSRLATDRLFVP